MPYMPAPVPGRRRGEWRCLGRRPLGPPPQEERLGTRLVEASSGGAASGDSHLTPAAQDLVRRFEVLRAGLDEQVAERFRVHFGGTLIDHVQLH
jgi:hypothetical protein